MLAAGGALAADKKMMKPSISVNGYYEGVVGAVISETIETDRMVYGDTDGKPDMEEVLPTSGAQDKAIPSSAIDTRTDAEIHFNGRAMLDNGVKIHARAELEVQQGGGGEQTDEYFIAVSGGFGKIVLGGTVAAPAMMLTGISGSFATGVGESLSYDNSWVPRVGGAPGIARIDNGDGQKVTYITPSLGGFQIGLSYVPRKAGDDDNKRVNANKDQHDGLEGAFKFSNKFGDVGVSFGGAMASYQAAKMGGSDLRQWQVSAALDFGGGFRVAGTHVRTEDVSQLTDVGVRYVVGSNSFSVTGQNGTLDDSDKEQTSIMASYARALGPGVKAHLNMIWNSSQGDWSPLVPMTMATPPRHVTTQDQNSGAALVAGIKVTF